MTFSPVAASGTQRPIIYHPEYSRAIGSVTATILLQQINHWFSVKKGRPFYKYSAPCDPCAEGDSWQEELGFGPTEFRTARDKIATKLKKGDKLKCAIPGRTGDETAEQYLERLKPLFSQLVYYWIDSNRRTWYIVNTPLFSALLSAIYPGESKSGENPILRFVKWEGGAISRFVNYEIDESLNTYTEMNTEINKEQRDSSPPAISDSPITGNTATGCPMPSFCERQGTPLCTPEDCPLPSPVQGTPSTDPIPGQADAAIPLTPPIAAAPPSPQLAKCHACGELVADMPSHLATHTVTGGSPPIETQRHIVKHESGVLTTEVRPAELPAPKPRKRTGSGWLMQDAVGWGMKNSNPDFLCNYIHMFQGTCKKPSAFKDNQFSDKPFTPEEVVGFFCWLGIHYPGLTFKKPETLRQYGLEFRGHAEHEKRIRQGQEFLDTKIAPFEKEPEPDQEPITEEQRQHMFREFKKGVLALTYGGIDHVPQSELDKLS